MVVQIFDEYFPILVHVSLILPEFLIARASFAI